MTPVQSPVPTMAVEGAQSAWPRVRSRAADRHRARFGRRPWAVALAAVLAVLASSTMPTFGLSSPAGAVAPRAPRTLTITGRGYGHGRGLGQYGAYGYAAQGWSSAQILDHYYGGTTAGPVPAGGPVDPARIRVELRFMRGTTVTVGLTHGTIRLLGSDGADRGQITTGAVRLHWVDNGYDVLSAPSCAGPWSPAPRITGAATLRLVAQSPAIGADGLLQACGAGYRSWYQGELRAVAGGATVHTVNVLPVEDYLRGVVPNEMPSAWPGPALEAQAVAARSYALAGDSRQAPYADTCDTTLCQVYDGAFTERGGFRRSTKASSDAAVVATAGIVRLTTAGRPARTEFSSSTGGYTAGGAFPAVVDDGDAIAANPYHDWSTTVDAATVETHYGKGTLQAVEVTGRTGLGADGGRATAVRLTFSGGVVNDTANNLRLFLGLRSDWFSPGPVIDITARPTPEGIWIDRMYQKLVGRGASDAELARWYPSVHRGDKLSLTSVLVRSDFFAGQLVDDLYQRTLGRPADPGGRAYWVDQLAGGLPLQRAGILFFGSGEYYAANGGTDTGFVTALYHSILGRDPDEAGLTYWTANLRDGRAEPADVAFAFYGSLESRRQRGAALWVRLAGSAPDAPRTDTGRADTLADRLLAVDDLILAAEIAAGL